METDLITTAALRELGLGTENIEALVTSGHLERLHRGVFARPCGSPRTPEQRHALTVRARMMCERSDVVASHVSAAVLHGLPIWGPEPDEVHLRRDRAYGGRRRRGLIVHGTRLDPTEVVTVDGHPTTTLSRTVVDVARTATRRQAIVTADAALASGLSRTELSVAIARADGWPGIKQARGVCGLADPLSESPGESVSRLVFADHGLPSAELQRWLVDRRGVRLGRVDFCWPEAHLVGEFDGNRKYANPFDGTGDIVDVVMAEKHREDAIREAGWRVIRWIATDLMNPARLVARLRQLLECSYTP